MKRQVKIFFEDYGRKFDLTEETIIKVLNREYNVCIDPNPDYLFFSDGGYKHLKYRNCIKIFYTGENTVPDFNLCDYALAHPHLQYGDRYLRTPYYLFSPEIGKINDYPANAEQALNRKFCNFLSSAGWADPFRAAFFKKLSEYKPIGSGGNYLNNIGGRVSDKMAFIKEYKFSIAFENSSLSGYTTEKIVEAMAANSLPVYWGNPDVGLDFNKESFVCVNDFDTPEAAIAEIIRLDNDDEAYLRKLSAPRCTGANFSKWEEQLFLFLKNIFDQPPNQAKRTTDYGFMYTRKRDMEALRWLFGGKNTGKAVRKLLRLSMMCTSEHRIGTSDGKTFLLSLLRKKNL
ncbi:Glycosyltransferase family 10 (fucosyltransferase) [Bacteroidales bacterium Barb6]|nr:Glycosyltransferase family 10 (fucosyltransferase) [Bacteroidales bacterium Barb6]